MKIRTYFIGICILVLVTVFCGLSLASNNKNSQTTVKHQLNIKPTVFKPVYFGISPAARTLKPIYPKLRGSHEIDNDVLPRTHTPGKAHSSSSATRIST